MYVFKHARRTQVRNNFSKTEKDFKTGRTFFAISRIFLLGIYQMIVCQTMISKLVIIKLAKLFILQVNRLRKMLGFAKLKWLQNTTDIGKTHKKPHYTL